MNRVSEVPHRRTILSSVLLGVAMAQHTIAQVETAVGEGMRPVVQGVGTKVAQGTGERGSNTLISNTRVGRMIPGDTSLPRHILEQRTMPTSTPKPTRKYTGTHHVRRLVRHTRVHRHTKMDNSTTIMAGMQTHNRPRQIMRTRHQQARTPTRRLIRSKDNTLPQVDLNTLGHRTPDRTHDTMSVRIRTRPLMPIPMSTDLERAEVVDITIPRHRLLRPTHMRTIRVGHRVTAKLNHHK